MSHDRNRMEHNGWVLEKVTDSSVFSDFDCDDPDLNEYFQQDSILHCKKLLSQSYCFHRAKDSVEYSFALVDFCNDSIRVKNLPGNVEIPEGKSYPFYPAIKVTRLGVRKEAQGQQIGSLLLKTIKHFFITDNRTGCRFITIDAYNNDRALRFYQRNGFESLTTLPSEKKTIPLIFDLLQIAP